MHICDLWNETPMKTRWIDYLMMSWTWPLRLSTVNKISLRYFNGVYRGIYSGSIDTDGVIASNPEEGYTTDVSIGLKATWLLKIQRLNVIEKPLRKDALWYTMFVDVCVVSSGHSVTWCFNCHDYLCCYCITSVHTGFCDVFFPNKICTIFFVISTLLELAKTRSHEIVFLGDVCW